MEKVVCVFNAVMAMLPIAKDTSFNDLTVTFEVWIFFGIFIIMNSKSPKDSALKCFIFFLISQPLVYLVQDIIKQSNLFNTYYRFWFLWTIACLPMGFIGYYMKKDKWWGLLILIPMLLLTGEECAGYLSKTMFSFPRHLLTTIFCMSALIIYPLAIFNNKKIKITGVVISSIIIIALTIICIINPPVYSTDILFNGEKYKFDDNVYSTDILFNGEKYKFDDNYKVYLTDNKYGELSIRYESGIEDWKVHAEFKKAGKTEFILESPDGDKITFDISIRRDTYTVKEKSN